LREIWAVYLTARQSLYAASRCAEARGSLAHAPGARSEGNFENEMKTILHCTTDCISTPIGNLMIAADEEGRLRAVLFAEDGEVIRHQLRVLYGAGGFDLAPSHDPHGLSQAITGYFEGDLGVIDGLPVETGGTPFQQDVWRALRAIPCGTTTSYGKLAERIGRPAAVRAVGLANGANPVAVVVPCHRVIGSNGSLTGYGGGLERKRWLLDHEKGQGLL
jgi:methylated-DNA-[protein]-cysteine S-methyltransferase